MFKRNQVYQLIDILDHRGKTLAEGTHYERDEHSRYVGKYTRSLVKHPTAGYSDDACLAIWFIQDEDGNNIRQFKSTQPIKEITAEDDRVYVRVTCYIYVFREAELKKPELREAKNLTELWIGFHFIGFNRGVHYDIDGKAHMLTIGPYQTNSQESMLLCHEDDLQFTVARYFPGYCSIEMYDILSYQQGFVTPMLIHTESNQPLTVMFPYRNDEWVIAPRGEATVQPSKSPDRR